jgi:hypothetical protein
MPMTAVTNVPADAPLADELMDEDLVEVANLPEEDSGIPRTIFVSTRMGRRGPRVKYFDGRAGEAQPSCSVTIADPPGVVANSLPDQIVRQRAPLVSAWVALNRDALLEFWNEGASWTRAEVSRFLDGVEAPQRALISPNRPLSRLPRAPPSARCATTRCATNSYSG